MVTFVVVNFYRTKLEKKIPEGDISVETRTQFWLKTWLHKIREV